MSRPPSARPTVFDHAPAPPVRTRLQVTGLTHRGAVRLRNQDAGAFADWSLLEDVSAHRRIVLGHPCCCAVADGAGGHPAGERASALALAALMAQAVPTDPDDLVRVVQRVHERLHREMALDGSCRGMATTLAALVATPKDILLVNVGDSRIYEVGEDGLLQLSVDDRPERPEWAETSSETSVLTQVIGGYDAANVPTPHVDRLHAEDGLRFLLCSDGLAACVDDDRVAQIIAAAADDRAAVRGLVDAALRAGAPDNVTVMLVNLQQEAQFR